MEKEMGGMGERCAWGREVWDIGILNLFRISILSTRYRRYSFCFLVTYWSE